MGTAEWLLLLLLAVLWGGSFFFFKILVNELPPFTVVLGRVGFAAIILQLYLLVRRDPMPVAEGYRTRASCADFLCSRPIDGHRSLAAW